MKYGVPTTVHAKSGVSRLSPKSPICARGGQARGLSVVVGKKSHMAEYWRVARNKSKWHKTRKGQKIEQP